MANLKRYTLEDAWKDCDVTVEVDHEILTEERAAEINSFWSGDEERLRDEDGDVVRAVIKYAARMWIYDLLEAGGVYVSDGGQSRYWTEYRHNMEGWGGVVEGSDFGWCGIRLVKADVEVDLSLEFKGA